MSGLWMAASSAPSMLAEESRERALVCVYLMIGGSDVSLAEFGRMNAELPEAAIGEVSAPGGQRYTTLRFLANGFFTPKWASPEGSPVAILPSGLTMASRTAADSGSLAAAAEAASFGMVFPPTGIGRQLRDAASVIRMRKQFGLAKPVFTATVSGFRPKEPARNGAILSDLSRALGAFYQATVEMNAAKLVTTFTDMDYGAAARGRIQAAIGETPFGGGGGISYETYTGTLRRWLEAGE